MSRTFRRTKRGGWEKFRLNYAPGPRDSWESYTSIMFNIENLGLTIDQIVDKHITWYHADSHSGTWTPPSEVCNIEHRRARRHDRQELHRYIHDLDYEYLMNPRKKTAAWLWW